MVTRECEVKTKDGLDFIICGMPRSGTTFLAQVLNGHSDIYSYFMETALFRQLWMFGEDRPFPSENLDELESWVKSQFNTQVDMVDSLSSIREIKRYRTLIQEYQRDDESEPGLRLFERDDVYSFTQNILNLFRRGLYGPSLMNEGSRLLAKYIGHKTKRSIIGEKTPDNIMALDMLYEGCPQTYVFCTVREPFSTIRSMMNCSQRGVEAWDKAFSSSFISSLAQYYMYLKKIIHYMTVSPPGKFHVMRYEDLVKEPCQYVNHIYGLLNVSVSRTGLEFTKKHSSPSPSKNISKMNYDDTETAFARLILNPLTGMFGYDDAFYRERGMNIEQSGIDVSDESAIMLDGIYQNEESRIENCWMSGEGSLFLVFSKSRERIVLNFWSSFPQEAGTDQIKLEMMSGNRIVGETVVNTGQRTSTIEVGREGLFPYYVREEFLGVHLHFRSSFSFRPITIPGMGYDMREISFMLRYIELK
jgi:hypothetical protein